MRHGCHIVLLHRRARKLASVEACDRIMWFGWGAGGQVFVMSSIRARWEELTFSLWNLACGRHGGFFADLALRSHGSKKPVFSSPARDMLLSNRSKNQAWQEDERKHHLGPCSPEGDELDAIQILAEGAGIARTLLLSYTWGSVS